MEDNQQTNWQEAINQGNAGEALKLYRVNDNSDDMIGRTLERLADIQSLLREKNVVKAKQLVVNHSKTLDWAEQLFNELQPQLATLEEATKHLDKHHPENALELLQRVTSPLLLAEKETLRGTALIYHNDVTGAKAAFEKALAHDSQHYRAITNLGNLALESGKVDEAITRYEHALKLNETFANAHHNLAVAYRKKGQVSKSVSELKKAQRVSQQKLREDARQIFRGGLFRGQGRKYLRWLVYIAIAVIVFLFLRQRGP